MSRRNTATTLVTTALLMLGLVTSLPAAGAEAAGSSGVVWDGEKFTSAYALRRHVVRSGLSWERFLDRHPSIVGLIRVESPATLNPPLSWDGKTFVRLDALRRHLRVRGVNSSRFLQRHPAIASRIVGPRRQTLKRPGFPKPPKFPGLPQPGPAPAPAPGTSPPPPPTTAPPTLPTLPTPPSPPPSTPPAPAATGQAGVAAPSAPAAYSLPAGATYVRSTAEFLNALRQPTRDIVLADGAYDNPEPFYNTNDHRIYAERVGGAVLHAGIVMGGNFGAGGGLIRGVRFDVASPAKTLGGGIVHVWGRGGVNTQVLDCTFRGNRSIPYGLLVYNPSGVEARRLEFYGFTDVALRASNNTLIAYGGQTSRLAAISDILVDGVTRSVPGSSNGTAEAGLWIGHPVVQGVRRVKIRNVSWSGLETVNNSWETVFSDLDIDMSGPSQSAGVAVYMEHFNFYNVFENFRITGAKVGFAGEWADPSWGGKPGANYVTIREGSVDTAGSTLPGNQAGVYLDEGSHSTTVTNVRFLNQNWAGIGAYRNSGTAELARNDFSQIASTAAPIRYAHISG